MSHDERTEEAELLMGEPGSSLDARVVERDQVVATVSADDLLRRLIGHPLETASGKPNRILDVVDGMAIVQTDRSPGGQAVPVRWVQSALETLWADGEVVIHPESVGYRSAFIGAVLRTLPGASMEGSPPMLRLNRATATLAPS